MSKVPTPNPLSEIPGCARYIPGKVSQNKFGNTFGHLTTGSYTGHLDAFLTTNLARTKAIKEHYSNNDGFWADDGKTNAFEEPKQEPKKNINRVEAKKFVPQSVTQLTYQQALKRMP